MRLLIVAAPPLHRFLLNPGNTTGAVLHAIGHLLVQVALVGGPPTTMVAAAVAGIRLVLHRRFQRSLRQGARLVTVKLPPRVVTEGAEILWSNLVALLHPRWRRLLMGQSHLAFELSWAGQEARIGLWVPGTVPTGMVERAVVAAWPGSHPDTLDPPPPPLPTGRPAAGGTLRLARSEWLPLRTVHPADPLRAVFGAAGNLAEAEAAAVQVLARPLTGRRADCCRRAARAVRLGQSVSAAGRLLELLPGPCGGRVRPADDPGVNAEVRAILDKGAGSQWEVVLRYGVSTALAGPETDHWLRGRAHALASAFAVYEGRNGLRRRRLRRPAEALAQRRMGRGDLLSVPELAALAHLPMDTVVAGMARAGARAVPPPPSVGSAGKVLGVSQVGRPRSVALSVEDARHHLHVMGPTGCGKSTELTQLVLQDVEAGRGAVVVDPKGDLVTDILDRLPERAVGRTVVIDPADSEAPPTLNPLEGHDPDLVVDHLVGIFRTIFERFWGPRTDDVLRAACLTLLRRGKATLADIPRLLSEPEFRARYVAGIDDRAGLGGFWDWYEHLSDAQQSQAIGPVLSKLRAFLMRSWVRRVAGSAHSSFDMGEVLDGGLCLVRVPKGTLGEATARLLGSFVVARVWQAATARARLAQEARIDATLYLDEAHNFLSLPGSLDDMLAEARGYRLSLVLAHQHLAQLPGLLREGISANARSKLFFALSPEDARSLERHMAPQLTAHDLEHLGRFQAGARLMVAGERVPAFTLSTHPVPDVIADRAAAVRAASRLRYGQSEIAAPPEELGRVLSLRPDLPDDRDVPFPVAYPSPYPSPTRPPTPDG